MSRRASKLSIWSIQLGLLAVSSFVAVILAEAGLRIAVDPADFLHATVVDDPMLGHRIPPLTTGHDALGFRNRSVPTQAAIVAIGDSMTYGVSASREDSWPKQLGALLGREVYNMGLGGYGPLQYLHLTRSVASSLRPQLVVVGFYFGNDLMDAFYVARGLPYWHEWRVSVEAVPSETEFDRAGREEPTRRFQVLRDWLSRNSLLYAVLRVVLLQRFKAKEQVELAQQAPADVRLLWRDPANPAVQTIFTPRHRLSAIDLKIQSVREGMLIAKKAFGELALEVRRQDTNLLVVLIPTKERAYCRYLRSSGHSMTAAFARLCDAEVEVETELKLSLDQRGIAHVDVLPALESSIAQHRQIYPMDADGHPAAAGYAAIAAVVADVVRQRFEGR